MVVVVRNRHRENVLLRVSRRRSLRLHSLAQKEAGHLMNHTHSENLILIFFLRFPQQKKSKVHDLYVNESQGSGNLETGLLHLLYAEPVYTGGAIGAINLNLLHLYGVFKTVNMN